MSLKIRLARGGAKKRPYYSIVVADSRSPRDGRFIEKLGTYNPMLDRSHADRVTLKTERIQHWLGVGALPTDRVARFLGDAGLVEKPAVRENSGQISAEGAGSGEAEGRRRGGRRRRRPKLRMRQLPRGRACFETRPHTRSSRECLDGFEEIPILRSASGRLEGRTAPIQPRRDLRRGRYRASGRPGRGADQELHRSARGRRRLWPARGRNRPPAIRSAPLRRRQGRADRAPSGHRGPRSSRGVARTASLSPPLGFAATRGRGILPRRSDRPRSGTEGRDAGRARARDLRFRSRRYARTGAGRRAARAGAVHSGSRADRRAGGGAARARPAAGFSPLLGDDEP